MTGWLTTIITLLGAALLIVARADLEDAAVFRWLTRRLLYRAAEHLPRGERARWREEAIRDALDLPGRLPPLLWALDTYAKSGRWGRARGVPSRWQVLTAWARATWVRLRSWSEERVRVRSKQDHPAFKVVRGDAAQVIARATLEGTAEVVPAGIPSSESFGVPQLWDFGSEQGGMMHLSHTDFIAWLARERQAFEDQVDQDVEAWRRSSGLSSDY